MKIQHIMSVREPYAHLLAAGLKSIENRSINFPRNIPLPVWVAVHASPDTSWLDDTSWLEDVVGIDPDIFYPIYDTQLEGKQRFHGFSEIIGAVEILGSVPYTEDDYHSENPDAPFSGFPPPDSRWNIPRSDWAAGDHCWIVGQSMRFRRPIVALGNLGVRVMPPELQKMVAQSAQNLLTDPTGFYESPVVYNMPKGLTAKQKAFIQ